mgnify:CR=1 FL=1
MKAVQSAKVDETAERFLLFLRAKGDEGATIGEAIDAFDRFGEDDRGRLHHRINAHLQPAGLIERDEGAIKTTGGANDADVFYITEWGEMWLDAEDEPVTDVEGAADVQASLSEVVGRVEDVESSVDETVEFVGKETEEFDRRLGRVEDEVDGAVEAVQSIVNAADSARADARAAADEVDRLQDEVEDLEESVAVLEKRLENEREAREELEAAIGDVGDGPTVEQRLSYVEKMVGWLEDVVSQHGEFFDDLASSRMVPFDRD